ncbi:MAG: thiamine pyrophosphate-dependent enzyme [Nanoarchaeota archaeon]
MTIPITWCPGCFNFVILNAVKNIMKGKEKEFAITTGIGCHGKIFDYLDTSGVYALHGRTLPVALGIKMANPALKVIAFSGDGDTYAEGISHLVHMFRYDADLTLIVNDNRVFSLTAGQQTPTTEQGFKTKASPEGSKQNPMNPIKLALASGCRFVARASALHQEQLQEILEKAIKHKGFSFVEVLQPCIIFRNDAEMIRKNAYEIKGKLSFEEAWKKASEWDYNDGGKIPVGIFYDT